MPHLNYRLNKNAHNLGNRYPEVTRFLAVQQKSIFINDFSLILLYQAKIFN